MTRSRSARSARSTRPPTRPPTRRATRRPTRRARPAACLAVLLACVLPALLAPLALAGPAAARGRAPRSRAVCARPHRGFAHCDAVVRLDTGGHPLVSGAPRGLTPADVQGAYGLPGDGGGGRVVALVDAYDDPTAAADLATYRATFGLPACTEADGCLRIVGGDGSPRRPAAEVGWAQEISLDLDAVSAACPGCHILLVEARSSSTADLLAAEATALAAPGVVAVSNSWGGAEPAGALAAGGALARPGVLTVASSGDSGYGVEWPASAPTVVAVGGTSLTVDPAHRRVRETAWSGAGSGCATHAAKPAWQRDRSCPHRAVADVAAVADPATGFAVRDTFGQPGGGWEVVGGTSLAAPLVAAVHAVSGSGLDSPAGLYSPALARLDITTGSNGVCPSRVLCHAARGWDGPTGVGSPAGTAGW